MELGDLRSSTLPQDSSPMLTASSSYDQCAGRELLWQVPNEVLGQMSALVHNLPFPNQGMGRTTCTARLGKLGSNLFVRDAA